MRVTTPTLFVLTTILIAASQAQAQDMEVRVSDHSVAARQGELEAEDKLTAAEAHVLKVATGAARDRVVALAGHRALGAPLRVTGTIRDGLIVGDVLTYQPGGVRGYGELADVLDDLEGETLTFRAPVTLSEEDVPPIGTDPFKPYYSEPVYTQWPARRLANTTLPDDLVGSEQVLTGTVSGGDLVTSEGSFRIVGETASWLRSEQQGARVKVKGAQLNGLTGPAFIVRHVAVTIPRLTRMQSASPLDLPSLPSWVRSKKTERWATSKEYNESHSIVAPHERVFVRVGSRSGFVATNKVKLVEPAVGMSGMLGGGN